MSGRGRLRNTKLGVLAVSVMLLAAGCASHAPQTTLKPQGVESNKIQSLFVPVFVIAVIVFILIIGGSLFIVMKFRARDDDDFNEFPEQVHGNFRLEIGWTILPALVLAVVGLFTVLTVFDLAKKPGPEALNVQVYGQQWWWEYRYDTNNDGNYTDIITANDLVVPAGRVISLHIRSRDVIHSWWAPALNGKKDAVPGHTDPLTITAWHTGEYIGQCTEFCGLSHAEMRIKVVALSKADFAKWVAVQKQPFKNPSTAQAIAGWQAFAGQCTTCHRITGMTDPSKVTGPKDSADATKIFTYPAVVNQVSGAAPNLTKFMSRTMFAGGKFNLRKKTPACTALGENWASTPKGIKECFNRTDLEAWLRNPPGRKAMKPGATMSPMSRGMPNLHLSETQIDQLIAFLTTLK